MGLLDRIRKGITPDEEEPFVDSFDDDEIYGNSDGGFGNSGDISDFMTGGGYSPYGNTNQNQGGYSQPQQPQQQTYQQSPQPSSNNNGGITVTASGNMQFSAELKVVKPEDYKSVNEIADHLINRRTVILNLEETNKETARRLIDFLTGVAYAIHGQLERVSERTFVIAPNNIVISPEQIREESARNSGNNNIDNSMY